MATPSKSTPAEKDQLHPRNLHRSRYDFAALVAACPELSKFVSLNAFGDLSVDFKDPRAVKTLNKALLAHFYGIKNWDIPAGYLCPPVPGRADYIHYAADLLAASNGGMVPRGNSIHVLDIGVGANCIYPLLGHKEYGWDFTGAETDPKAIRLAKEIVLANGLPEHIHIRKQPSAAHIFTGVIKRGEKFDLTICNPPFHASIKEAMAGTERKWKNLGQKSKGASLNFGGNPAELCYEGGEERFLALMIEESTTFAASCQWFTSLVSKKETLHSGNYLLKKAGAKEVKTIPMAQGQKVSRILAWTFMDNR